MGAPFWENGTFWTAVGTIVAVLVAVSNVINWMSKRHDLSRKKERASQLVHTHPTYSHNKTSEFPGQEELSSPVPQKELSTAQDAVVNWWADYSYDGRASIRSDEFDLDLHYRSEEVAHNTKELYCVHY